MLVSDDFLLEARGGEYRFAILVFFVLASVLGIPLSWHKTLIRSSGSASNCYLSHHGRSEKKRTKHTLATLESLPPIPAARPPRKNNFMLNRQPWRKLKKERPARLASRRKVAISWSNRACSSGAFSTHSPLSTHHGVLTPRVIAMLHCTGPCNEAFLTHWALSVSNETSGQAPVAVHPVHVRTQGSL